MSNFSSPYTVPEDRPVPESILRILAGVDRVATELKCLYVQERWSKRELERQIKGALFERAVLTPAKVSPVARQMQPEALSVFKDAYMLEFLDLPAEHAEADLHRALLLKLRDFLIELGRDFCFVGSEYPLQVGGRDFALDLLFFHRGLSSLVALELKVGRFEPECLGKLAFT